jgi:hypothetical protein
MRWLLVAPGDLVRLIGIGGVMLGLGAVGDQVAGWVRSRGLPSDPIARRLITCPRCSGDGALCPPDGRGQWHYACPELALLNAPVLAHGLAIAHAAARHRPCGARE